MKSKLNGRLLSRAAVFLRGAKPEPKNCSLSNVLAQKSCVRGGKKP